MTMQYANCLVKVETARPTSNYLFIYLFFCIRQQSP